ncbi:MAG: cupin domain-containing protein [Bryobacteraceae bacterium]
MAKKVAKNAKVRVSGHALLNVGQTARILGVSPSTLRLWENVGLISPARSSGKYRLYNPEMLALLKRVKYLRDVKKLTVPGIKEALGKNLRTKRHTSEPECKRAIGKKLRQLRRLRGLGIAEAARRAGISTGFLSAIELSQANPSVATLYRLSAAYDTTTLEFFDPPRGSRRLTRPHERLLLRTDATDVCMELLSIGTKMLECMLFRVPPNAGSNGSYSHAGEEFIFMLEGRLEIWLDEVETHVLEKGDSFWFESNLGHRWFNPLNEEAVLLWVNTPPTF